MKIRHRTRPIDATRVQTVRQSLHSGQVRAHTRTSRMELRVHVLRLLLLLRVVLLLMVVRPRVSLVVVLLLVKMLSIRMSVLHLVRMLVMWMWPRMPAVMVIGVQRVWRGFASGCIG